MVFQCFACLYAHHPMCKTGAMSGIILLSIQTLKKPNSLENSWQTSVLEGKIGKQEIDMENTCIIQSA